MNVLNVHERRLSAPKSEIGALIDSLSSRQDWLWPKHTWPRMEFDRPLQVGATGGHGPIRYFVEDYVPASSIRFRFTGPKGFIGHHRYEVLEIEPDLCLLRHTLEMKAEGLALLTWPLVFHALHDALIEDSLALAQTALGLSPSVSRWSPWVRFLRWVASRGKARTQTIPDPAVTRDAPQAARPLP